MGSACSNGSTTTTEKPTALTSIARQGTATTNVSVESIQIGSASGFSRVPQSPGIPFGCNPPGVPSTATMSRPFPPPAGSAMGAAPPHEFPPPAVQGQGGSGNNSVPDTHNNAGHGGATETEGTGTTDDASGSEDASENDRWTRVKLLGQGGFGSVYLVRNNRGQELAVKVINFDSRSPTITKNIKMLQKELTVLRKAANHHNLIKYIKAQRVSSQIHIFMEFCPRGSLRTLYKERKAPLTLDECRMYTRDILQGLEFLHSQNVIHRDVKCDNVLIGPDGFGKLADFGAATTVLDQSQRTQVGSVYWMAPEILFNKGHRWHADIWSTGCTVMEMASARPPHSNRATGYNALFAYIQDFVPENAVPPEITQPDIVSFIITCLQPDREKRPSTTVLLQHPLVAGINRLPDYLSDPAAHEIPN